LINKQDPGTERTLSKSADDTELGGLVHALDDGAVIQRDLSWVEIQTDTNLTQFSKKKCKVFHLGRNNHMHQYRLRDNCLDCDFAGKDLRFLEDKLSTNQQQALATKMAKSILGFVRRNIATRSREIFPSSQ